MREREPDGDAHREGERGGAAGDDEREAPGAQVQLDASGAEDGLEGEARKRRQQDEPDRAGHRPSALFTLSRSASDAVSVPHSTFIARSFESSSETSRRTGIWRDGPLARRASVSGRRSQSTKRRPFAAWG